MLIYICGQTDRHNEAKWSFSDYANVPKGGPKPGIAKFISNRSKNTEGVGGTHGRVKNNISVEKHLKKGHLVDLGIDGNVISRERNASTYLHPDLS